MEGVFIFLDLEFLYLQDSFYTQDEVPDSVQLLLEDGILRLSWTNFVLQPISHTELIIQSGAFEGETMFRDPNTGFLYWGSRVFKPST